MAIVTVLGTGIMGAPIAHRLVGAGHEVRVWNRTIDRMEPLVDAGIVDRVGAGGGRAPGRTRS